MTIETKNFDEDGFHCSSTNSSCIPWLWVCDGDSDCADGDDEDVNLCGQILILSIIENLTFSNDIFAEHMMCPDGAFRCRTGFPACVNWTLLCDGIQHCSDNSDEESCGKCSMYIIIEDSWIQSIETCEL